MIVLETIAVAFGMFSRLPLPQPEWNERNMRWMLAAFPLVGAVVSLCCAGWVWLCGLLNLGTLPLAGGLCVLPVLVTGGIHLDGYADTCDALASCAPPEKKQAILADPHCGAFAVIKLIVYFVVYFCLCTILPLDGENLLLLGLAFPLSRSLSGLAVVSFPLARGTGLAHSFASAADKPRLRTVLGGLAALLMAALAVTGGIPGACIALAAAAALLRYRRVAEREFGGISGDLAGWFLQKAELWMLAALALVPRILEVLP